MTKEEYIEKSFRKPPIGEKNIDAAKSQMRKLEESVYECSSDTPALTFSSTRWLENAFYSREITEDDYDRLMLEIKKQTRLFIDKCDCNKTIEKREPIVGTWKSK